MSLSRICVVKGIKLRAHHLSHIEVCCFMAILLKYETLSSNLICNKKNVTVCFFTYFCSKTSKVMPIFLNILQPKFSVIVTLDAHFSPL
jgi:hypothetical protein